jgi:hypothetical protein
MQGFLNLGPSATHQTSGRNEGKVRKPSNFISPIHIADGRSVPLPRRHAWNQSSAGAASHRTRSGKVVSSLGFSQPKVLRGVGGGAGGVGAVPRLGKLVLGSTYMLLFSCYVVYLITNYYIYVI